MQKVTTFLMFEGNAEEAMNFYISLFPGSEVTIIRRYRENEAGPLGKVHHAVFTMHGQQFMCIDSVIKHEFSFTPAMSLFVNCENEAEIDSLYQKLSAGGKTLMPLDSYPFSKKYAWLVDRFDVSWQITLPL